MQNNNRSYENFITPNNKIQAPWIHMQLFIDRISTEKASSEQIPAASDQPVLSNLLTNHAGHGLDVLHETMTNPTPF